MKREASVNMLHSHCAMLRRGTHRTAVEYNRRHDLHYQSLTAVSCSNQELSNMKCCDCHDNELKFLERYEPRSKAPFGKEMK